MKRTYTAKIAPFIAGVLALVVLSGCHSDRGKPHVDYLDGSFTLVRTEHVLFTADTTTANDPAMDSAFSAHPIFWDLYLHQVMAGGDSVQWTDLARNPFLRAIADSVAEAFPDMQREQAQFESAFQHLQYYFPGNRVPNVYTLVSGFGYFPFIFEDADRDGLGVSLEMFLGSDFPYRSFAGQDAIFSDYLVRTYNRDHLVKRTVEVLVDDMVGQAMGDRLLDIMVVNGKRLYILEQLMPDLQDTVLFEFTPDQLQWCTENERQLWAHFLKDDLLYATEFQKIQKLIAPAPTVTGMPAEAPGGVANWTGWKIIHSLMQRNPDMTMNDLLAMHDAQALLELARYRPG